MKRLLLLCLLLCVAGSAHADATLEVQPAGAVLSGGPVHLTVTATEIPSGAAMTAEVLIDGQPVSSVELVEGEQTIVVEAAIGAGQHRVDLRTAWAEGSTEVRGVRGWLSILPPLIAIILALATRDVLISLFLGVFSGALILYAWNPITAFARSIDTIIVPALADGDHAKIIIFSLLLGGMVGVITKSGGTQGIVERLRGSARTARRGQVATWMMGVLIFFDDYANTLIVGSTMRPITDRLRISREKLAYIVDSTAAPVASVFPISTWVGFEVGLIAAAFTQLSIPYNAYATFIASIAYRFYPIFALVLGFTIAFSCRDRGPMLRAELRASETGAVIGDGDTPLSDSTAATLAPPEGKPLRARNAFIPIGVVIGVTIVGLYVSGSSNLVRAADISTWRWLQDVFSAASSLDVLLWASLSAAVTALTLAVAQRILTPKQAMEGLVGGFKSMLLAIVVLVLAWSIGQVTGLLHTADYVVGFTSGILSPQWLPVLVFLMAAGISFATGTSWGTMAILMPLVIPVAHRLSLAAGHPMDGDPYYGFMLGTISSVLAGSVWGDHCSPISDTTILSSMGSGCDHIAHVKTQMPYAFGIGLLGMVVGDIPTAYGMSPWISILVGSAIIVGGVLLLGKRSDYRPGEKAAAASATAPGRPCRTAAARRARPPRP